MGLFGNNNSAFFGPKGPADSPHEIARKGKIGNVEIARATETKLKFRNTSRDQLRRIDMAVAEAEEEEAKQKDNSAQAPAQEFYINPAEQNLRNAGYTLAWQHVPTGREVEFKAFVEQISDAFTSNWQTESVYGRMDEIASYQNTVRAIAVLWHIPANSLYEAIQNQQNVQHLMQFLYPVYDSNGIIAAPPLMRLRFGNLIRNAYDGGGLLGHVNGFTVDPDPEAGWFTLENGPMTGGPEIYPKSIRLNCDFTVLHEHDLGYKKTKNGFMFRGGEHDEKNPTGIDFPWPAGAGNPNMAQEELTPNSHLAKGVKPTDEDKIKNRKHFRSVTQAKQQANMGDILAAQSLNIPGVEWSSPNITRK
jgi:hypothetical protein